MTTPRDFIDTIENANAEPLSIGDTSGALLLHLLVHMFFADEELHEKEVEVLKRVVGADDAELEKHVGELNSMPMNWAKLAETFPDEQDRQDIITLAEHGFWADNQMKFSEMDVLDKLAEVLEITER